MKITTERVNELRKFVEELVELETKYDAHVAGKYGPQMVVDVELERKINPNNVDTLVLRDQNNLRKDVEELVNQEYEDV